MTRPSKRVARRWPLIVACALVFLFAFHAKTGIYSQGLRGKPQTATASKMWLKIQRIPKPPINSSFLASSPSLDYQDFTWGLVLLHLPVSSGFVPVPCFSGLSPPTFAQERP